MHEPEPHMSRHEEMLAYAAAAVLAAIVLLVFYVTLFGH
jgi:hypothetical protein